MKKGLFVALCICLPVLASGQSAPTSLAATISANRIQRTGLTTLELRGAVRITIGGTQISADEVDWRLTENGTSEFDVRGNAHVTVPGQ
jgi:hypothetical protein